MTTATRTQRGHLAKPCLDGVRPPLPSSLTPAPYAVLSREVVVSKNGYSPREQTQEKEALMDIFRQAIQRHGNPYVAIGGFPVTQELGAG